MLASLLVASNLLEDPREQLIERLWLMDSRQFFERTDAFGVSRIEVPVELGKHKIIGRTMEPEYSVDRFLVGNKTERFDAHHLRTSSVPVARARSKEAPPSYPIKEVELLVRRFLGTDFKTKDSSNRLVWGYRLTAKLACLNCHKKAKEGDALGYLVYAVGAHRAKVR